MERLDLYARLHLPTREMIREVERLKKRIGRSGLKYRQDELDELKLLVESPQIDYYSVVLKVENLMVE